MFAERVAEYRATVHRVGEAEVGATVQRIAEEEGARRIGIPADLPSEWRPSAASGGCRRRGAVERWAGGWRGLRARRGRGLSVQELDALDGALTGCAVAIAETGTFVLDGGVGQGRRALSLVPDLHVCVVREDQVVGLVPEAVGKLEDAVRSGASAHVRVGPVRHLGHRARQGRGRAWAARAPRGARGLMRTVYLGTSDFAATVLDRLAASPHRPQLVVTRPDAPRGRGRKLAPPPVAETAGLLGIEVFQPEDVNSEQARQRIARPSRRRSRSAPTAPSSRSRCCPSTRC